PAIAAGGRTLRRHRRRGHPATGLDAVGDRERAARLSDRSRRSERRLGGPGTLHWRDLAEDAGRLVPLLADRAFGAPPALQRDRRGAQSQAAGGGAEQAQGDPGGRRNASGVRIERQRGGEYGTRHGGGTRRRAVAPI